MAARYSPNELERRIYGTTLADVKDVLWEVLQRHDVPLEDFALLGESGWRRVLDDMPARKADMHMRRQWAKNAQLTPRDSDLNDWVYLGIAVAYCDVVATEKQATSLFARGVSTRASVVTNLAELPALLA